MIRGKPNYLMNSITFAKNDMAASVTVDTRISMADQGEEIGEIIFGVQVNLQA